MTYLYVKQHNVTGLKYFGYTKRSDVDIYLGSGTRWRRHLRRHGRDISTPVLMWFDSEMDLNEYALKFSVENDIVNSDEWANMTVETGSVSHPKVNYVKTAEHKQKLSESLKRVRKTTPHPKGMLGKHKTLESNQKTSESLKEIHAERRAKGIIHAPGKGKTPSLEARQKRRESLLKTLSSKNTQYT